MALTLRSVAGLTVPEIARGFLSTDSAMERRLTRARNKVSDARIPFRVPTDDLLVERLAGVLRVVYLVFNEGHALRPELRAEAIRLARLLVRLMPDEAEVHGLLALFLLTDARSRARVVDGELVSLAEQDRALVGSRRDRRGRARARAGAAAAAAGLLRDPGRDRRRARRGARLRLHRLGADRRPLRAAAAPRPVAGGGAQPRRRGRLRRGRGGRARAAARRSAPRALRAAARRALRAAAPHGRRGRGRRGARRRDRALGQRRRTRRAPQIKGQSL